MPTICLKVTAETKELWVEAASKQLLTLSEWLRQAAEAKLSAQSYTQSSRNIWAEEDVESAFKEHLRESVSTKIADPAHGSSEQVLEHVQPSAPEETDPSWAPGITDRGEGEQDGTAPSPDDAVRASLSSAPAPPVETEEVGGPGSPSSDDSGAATPTDESSASVSAKEKLGTESELGALLRDARSALTREFKPDFKPEKGKKKRR